jgi:hypothetical protein
MNFVTISGRDAHATFADLVFQVILIVAGA